MTSIKRKHAAVLRNIRAGNPATAWADVEGLLFALGAERHPREGVGVIFTLKGALIRIHRVHGRRECGAGLVARVRAFLTEADVP